MKTFTMSKNCFQHKWDMRLCDEFKAWKLLTFLCLFFLENNFNLSIQAQSTCAYNISLVSRTYNATENQTTFVWRVVNPNPGNGNNGTVQDLSHWGFSINQCPDPNDALNEESIVRAGTGSSPDPNTHSSLNVGLHVDNSQQCINTPVLKFNRGTSGSAPRYYSLVLHGNWGTGNLNAYYKSGSRTGCGLCTLAGMGVGCLMDCPQLTVNIISNMTQFPTNRTVGLSVNIGGGTSPATATWSSPTAGVSFNNTSSITPVATVAPGISSFTFNVNVTDANGCPGSATLTLSPTQLCPLTTPILGTPVAICPGTSTGTITVTNPQAGVTYQLLRNGVAFGAAVIYTSGNLSFTGLAVGTYSVRITFESCEPVTSATAVIAASNVPAPTFGTIGTLCPGATATLSATFPAGTTVTNVVWSGTGVSGTTFTAPAAGGMYTVNYSATVNGCPVTGSFTITVSTVPVPVFGTIGTLCPGATATLSATFPAGTTVTGVVWSGTGVSGTTFTAPAAGGVFTVNYSATVNGCPVTGSFAITVSTVPAPVFGTIGTLCPGATATLSATFPAGTTVTGVVWSGTGVSGTTFTAPAAGGSYTVNYSATVNGCPVTGSFTITVASAPATLIVVGNNFCPGGSGTITVQNIQAGISYQVRIVGGANIGAAQSGAAGTNLTFTNIPVGTFQIVATNISSNCMTVFGNVTIAQTVVTPCMITGPTSVCMGTRNTYTVQTGPGVTNIQWSIQGGNCIIVGTATTATVSIKAIGPGTFIIRATVMYGNCPTSCELTVTSTPLTVSAAHVIVCPNSTGTLVGSPAGGVWASTNPLIQAAINNSNSTFNSTGIPAGNYPVTYTVIQADSCTGTALGSITILSAGVIGRLAGNYSEGEMMEITMDRSTKGIRYQLLRNGVAVGSPVNGTGSEINFGPHTFNGEYSVRASNLEADCSATSGAQRILPTNGPATLRVDAKLKVTAFPNPFSDQIRFVIESDIAGKAVLEVYNLLGAKLQTVYEGHVDANKKLNVDFVVPELQRVHMIYKLRVGNYETTGKLINIR